MAAPARARRARPGSARARRRPSATWFALREEVGPTEFLGYETESAEGVILAILEGERAGRGGQRRRRGRDHRQPDAVLRRIRRPGRRHRRDLLGRRRRVRGRATQQERRAISSSISARCAHGTLKVGDAVELRVDGERRRRLRANHSVTHLLHQALRQRLGEHVTQKGSLVAPDRLRFDFSHPRPLSHEDIAAIEAEVNARIRDNSEVRTRLLTPEQAVEEGALALFGEKYGDEVRVVAMGGSTRRRGAALIRSSCAAARMSAAPAISACSRSSAKARSPRACAASRR